LRLGSLHVVPIDVSVEPIVFDPRGPDGIDGGFHAWLEKLDGELLDPSICPTLAAEGYDVDGGTYFTERSKKFVMSGLGMIYEELPNLELLGLEASEPGLRHQMNLAMLGILPPEPIAILLDVGWRH
jgi:hypothetical protein